MEWPSDWVNALLLVEKPNEKLRFCSYPKDPNKVNKEILSYKDIRINHI